MYQINLPVISQLISLISIFVPQSHGYELTFPFFRDGNFTDEANEGNLNHDEGMVKSNEKDVIHIIFIYINGRTY